MRRFWIVLITVLIVATAAWGTPSGSVSASKNGDAAAAKKKCKAGYHRVSGKCKKKKPVIAPSYYVAIGDSLTYGTGADSPKTQSYPALLAGHLPSGRHFLNLGVPGITAGDAQKTELPRALASHPKIATVWLGGNDVLHGDTAAEFTPELESILNALQTAQVRVFVATLPDFSVAPATSGNTANSTLGRADNAAIVATAARHGDTVIDVYAVSKSLWGHPEFVSSDGLHLNAKGYAAVADVFYRVMHAQGALGP